MIRYTLFFATAIQSFFGGQSLASEGWGLWSQGPFEFKRGRDK